MGTTKNLLIAFLMGTVVTLFYILFGAMGLPYIFEGFTDGEFMIFNLIFVLIFFIGLNEVTRGTN